MLEVATKSLYTKSPGLCRALLTEYSVNQSRLVVSSGKAGRGSDGRYCDGTSRRNVTADLLIMAGVPEKIDYPGYSDWFYRQIVKATGDRYGLPADLQGKNVK